MKKHKNKIITGVIIALVLTVAFLHGTSTPQNSGKTTATVQENTPPTQKSKEYIPPVSSEKEHPASEDTVRAEIPKVQETEKVSPVPQEKEVIPTAPSKEEETSPKATFSSGKSAEVISKVKNPSLAEPAPIEPEDAVITDRELTCTLSVRCDTVLDNIEKLDDAKVDIIPRDGVLFAEKTVTFYEGESVFNLLLREMKRARIHMEFENTPIYNSAYIEGIANIYEFDCGELSGWMYSVNGRFPNYGSSRYALKEGDKVEWVYTCDLGRDVGGHYSPRNGR